MISLIAAAAAFSFFTVLFTWIARFLFIMLIGKVLEKKMSKIKSSLDDKLKNMKGGTSNE